MCVEYLQKPCNLNFLVYLSNVLLNVEDQSAIMFNQEEANIGSNQNLHKAVSDDNECLSVCGGTSNGSESSDIESSLYLSENSEHDDLCSDTESFQELEVDDLCSDTDSYQEVNSFTSEPVNTDTMPSVDHSVDHAVNVGLLSVMDKHSLSYACVVDMLKLMSASVPSYVSSSLHMLLSEFVRPKDSMKVHQCCSSCTKLLEPETRCTMSECIAQGLPISSFIEVKLDYQLRLMFTGKSKIGHSISF